MTLVIMAAGMGSRYGGLKQIESVGPNGGFIIDYSIYDAIKAGFTKVVFIIKEENYEIFRSTIGKRIENYIKVEYVFQNNDNVLVSIPKERTKPLGTAHAVLCCKDVVNENFAIINADDFYGRDAYFKVGNFIKNNKIDNEFAVIGYNVLETITDNGSVKRGICNIKNNYNFGKLCFEEGMKIEMNRTEMRENAFKLIYSLEIQKVENVQEQINLYFESNNITDEEAKKYIANAVNGIEEHQEEILKNIETNLKEEWKLSRISKMDLTILKLAIYEIKFTDVPYKVSINEAVELAKKYGEDKSKNFVNGILASVVKEM